MIFIIISAGVIRRWKLPSLAAGYDKAPVDDDPRRAQYESNDAEHDESPFFNQLFAAMYDLILCSIPKLGLLTSTPGRSIAEIFEEEIPNFGENDWEERYLVSPELIAYLQWLIYSAQYKSQDQGAREDEHKKY